MPFESPSLPLAFEQPSSSEFGISAAAPPTSFVASVCSFEQHLIETSWPRCRHLGEVQYLGVIKLTEAFP